MAQGFKKVGAVAGFEAYRNANKVVIYEDGEYFVQYGRRDGHGVNYRNPIAYIEGVIANRIEAEADKVEMRRARERFVAAYMEKRAVRVARQPEFAF